MTARGSSRWLALALLCAAVFPATAAGQQRPPAPTLPPPQPLSVRGFADVGASRFAAADTFEAVLGSATGILFGGGGEVVLPQRIFANVRVSRFEKTGERVFASDGEVFPLGIDTTARITPIELTGGYRFAGLGRTRSLIPYLGGGVGWHKYEETSDFAEPSENVEETFTGYHVLGGMEYRVGRLFGIGGEVQWTTVPDALGSNLSSASEVFDESDLGGLAFRVRFVIGR